MSLPAARRARARFPTLPFITYPPTDGYSVSYHGGDSYMPVAPRALDLTWLHALLRYSLLYRNGTYSFQACYGTPFDLLLPTYHRFLPPVMNLRAFVTGVLMPSCSLLPTYLPASTFVIALIMPVVCIHGSITFFCPTFYLPFFFYYTWHYRALKTSAF